MNQTGKITYEFKGFLWKHDGPSGWFFILLTTEISAEIRSLFQWQEEGWGRLKTSVRFLKQSQN